MKAADVFRKLPVELKPDPSRTVIRPFDFAYPDAFARDRLPRHEAVVQRLLALTPAMRERMWRLISRPMCERHPNAPQVFLRRFEEVKGDCGDLAELKDEDRLLIGAYFSQEYAFEAAALFNPSICRLPDPPVDGGRAEWPPADDEEVRFVLSLRGVGEGHISSVTFRTGIWDGGDGLVVDTPSPHGVPPRVESDHEGWMRLSCPDAQDVSETVVFPVLPSQRSGVEDLRLVEFADHDGTHSVIGTYTAFDGSNVRQELLRGVDLRTFEMRALTGRMAGYKGMALFPRRIGGRFAMLGRQDNENIWLLWSNDLNEWDSGDPLMGPKYPWEFVQIGNCGSPIEIDEGWLVFTHGVGMIRGYSIGACLLDKEDPSRVIKRTRSPILFPSAEQRGGYVPNVTYSCGALVHKRNVLLPYGIGDQYTAFATGSVDELLEVMEAA